MQKFGTLLQRYLRVLKFLRELIMTLRELIEEVGEDKLDYELKYQYYEYDTQKDGLKTTIESVVGEHIDIHDKVIRLI